ncbi:MAG: hypothetical protein HQL35_04875 [Alphaproteobacteria bacterium]|nr:hypothetical protein [Alphaproteobacteria bacterium]
MSFWELMKHGAMNAWLLLGLKGRVLLALVVAGLPTILFAATWAVGALFFDAPDWGTTAAYVGGVIDLALLILLQVLAVTVPAAYDPEGRTLWSEYKNRKGH